MEVVVPKRVCVKRISLINNGYVDFMDWVSQPRNIYIGQFSRHVRGTVQSKWHNPFPLKDLNLEDSLLLFSYITRSDSTLMDSIIELDGKHLGCFCRLPSDYSCRYTYKGPTCHGNIIINIFRERYNIPDLVPEGGTVLIRGAPQDWVLKNREQWVEKNEIRREELFSIIHDRCVSLLVIILFS